MKQTKILKVLIVDDEPDICFLLTTLIRSRNVETGYAYTLADAASELNAINPAVIFLDNSLPDGKRDRISFLCKT